MLVTLADDDEKFCDALRQWYTHSPVRSAGVALEVYQSIAELQARVEEYLDNSGEKLVVVVDLDFKGDKHGGLDLLQSFREDSRDEVRRLPVIIYSNTDDANEINYCYVKAANSFVWKGGPSSDDQKRRFLGMLEYWLKTAETPTNSLGLP